MLTLLEQMKRSQVWQVATDIVNAFSILIRRSETFHIHLGLTTIYIDGLAIGLSYLSHPMLSYSRGEMDYLDIPGTITLDYYNNYIILIGKMSKSWLAHCIGKIHALQRVGGKP